MSEHDPRIGRVLDGKWTLERLLGSGGMASVYAARHRNGARAAVKILHPELAQHQEIRERFLREGYAANRVQHPGAVAVLDDDIVREGPEKGAAYIVMEMLEGELLEDRVERGPFTEVELLGIADSLLEVLEAAHQKGVIHRDLKPDNLFLLKRKPGESPRVKVLDFGLARLGEGKIVTRMGVALGTPAYMSPEQAAGRSDEIDGRADLFSLGAVLFRLRTGRRIHDANTAIELVGKMARQPAPPVRDVDETVSPRFAAIVDRALAFAREDRYPDAATMQRDVRAALEALAPPAPPLDRPVERGGFPWVLVLLLTVGGAFVAYRSWPKRKVATHAASSVTQETSVLDAGGSDGSVDTSDEANVASDATSALAPLDDAPIEDSAEDAEEDEEEDLDADLADAEADAEPDAQGDAHPDAQAAAVHKLLEPHAPAPAPKKPPPPPPAKKKTTKKTTKKKR